MNYKEYVLRNKDKIIESIRNYKYGIESFDNTNFTYEDLESYMDPDGAPTKVEMSAIDKPNIYMGKEKDSNPDPEEIKDEEVFTPPENPYAVN